jgi:hypothetical protein
VASATTAATVVATGYAYTALYAGKTCALNQVPSSVNQFTVNTCAPYAAATGATYGGVAALGYARSVYSYQSGVSSGAAVYTRIHAEGYFSDAACAGTLLNAVYYVLFSSTAPVCTSDGTNQIVWYSSVPFDQVPSTVWPAFGTSSTSLSTLNGAMYTATSYWWSLSTCQAPGGANNVPPYVRYIFQHPIASCSAVDYTFDPSLSWSKSCSGTVSTATNTNGYAILNYYNNPTCTGNPVRLGSWQLNICWLSSTTVACNTVVDPTGKTVTILSYNALTCSGPSYVFEGPYNLGVCTPVTSGSNNGLYRLAVVSSTPTSPSLVGSFNYFTYVCIHRRHMKMCPTPLFHHSLHVTFLCVPAGAKTRRRNAPLQTQLRPFTCKAIRPRV